MKQEVIDQIKNQLDNENLSYRLNNIIKIYNEKFKLPYNYKWYHAGIMANCHTDLYNRNCINIIFNEINGFNKDYVESLKNENHHLIESYIPRLNFYNKK